MLSRWSLIVAFRNLALLLRLTPAERQDLERQHLSLRKEMLESGATLDAVNALLPLNADGGLTWDEEEADTQE